MDWNTIDELIKKQLKDGSGRTFNEILLAARVGDLKLSSTELRTGLVYLKKKGAVRSKTVTIYWRSEKQQKDAQTTQ